MSMPELYKQNRRQWIAIVALFMVFWIEYQCRIDMQYEYQRKLELSNQAIITLQAQNELSKIPLRPKHRNHEHGYKYEPLK